jgi:hypothetical protein
MTVIIICLNVPAFLKHQTDGAMYYKPGTKLGEDEWPIPDHVDVLILSGEATKRLLSAAVFDYFSATGETCSPGD